MSRRSVRRLVREGEFVAEVAVELIDTEAGWTPYLSLEDAYKLDDVRGVASGRCPAGCEVGGPLVSPHTGRSSQSLVRIWKRPSRSLP